MLQVFKILVDGFYLNNEIFQDIVKPCSLDSENYME